MKFSDLNLNKPLLNALNDLGFETPTAIQERAFSTIMSGRDVMGLAQTGTGKTLAYLLPLLRLWKFQKDRFPRIMIIVPTRELAEQIANVVRDLTKYSNVEVAAVYGGVNMKRQVIMLDNGLDVIVGTPGRLNDLALYGSLKLVHIKKLVIDEADEMLNLGFRTQLNSIFDLMTPKRQNLLFSATMTTEVEKLINENFNFPEKIEAAPMGTPLENIDQFVYEAPNFYTKVNLLKHLLTENTDMSKVLIFTATKKLADHLFVQIDSTFPEQIGVIHSNKSQNFRFRVVKNFADGTHRIVIATDIVARGIDISEVTHVINFDMPQVPENYIHRIGRTGRADKKGHSISFVSPKEIAFRESVEELMSTKIPTLELPEIEISDVIADHEKEVVKMKNIVAKIPKPTGGAFHKKLEKNLKVNRGSRKTNAYKAEMKKISRKAAKRRNKK